MPTNSYDLIVVGDDLAGLCAAALCARRGLRTLVLGDDQRPARYTLGPFKLPVDPGGLPGRGAGAAARVIRELGLDHALKRRVREARITAQLVGPDCRLDLVGDAAAQSRELVRELPTAATALATAWEEAATIAASADEILHGEDAFPGVGFFERRDVAKHATRAAEAAAAWWQRRVDDGPLVAALTALPAAVGGRTAGPPPLAIARALEHWRAGSPLLRGDGTGLRELLLERLRTANGELRTGEVAEIHSGWTKLTGLKLASGDELGAGQLVVARPMAELLPAFGKKPPKRLVELAAAQRLLGWRYTLNLVLDAAAVPEGMAPTVLSVIDPAAPLGDDNAFVTWVGEPDDQGRVIVTVSATLLATDEEAATPPEPAALRTRARALREALWLRLDELMPFFADHLVVAHSPHDGAAPVAPGGRGTYELGRGLPATMAPVWKGELPGAAGLAGAPYAGGVKNLTLASAQVLPNLGLEGDLVVGWCAAREACAIGGKKRDYLRDEVVSA